MSCTGKKRSRNRGTRSSTPNQICRNNSGKISKYFTKKEREDSESSDLSDSPYKDCINETKSAKLNNSASDLDDFKTPIAINKVSKLSQARQGGKNVKKRKKVVQAPLRKFMENNLKHSDVNPDHLQMALAMSESSYEAENPNAIPSSQEKRDSFKKALEKYGFGYTKNRVSVEVKREITETRKNKKSKYKYITPVLKMRTNEEREALISSKVSLILAQNRCNSVGNTEWDAPPLHSQLLQKYSNSRLYQLNRLDLRGLNEEGTFYVHGLAVEACPAPCGCLLKDWGRIAGRDPTPEREMLNSPVNPKLGEDSTIKSPLLLDKSVVGNSLTSPTEKQASVQTCEIISPFVSEKPCGGDNSEDKFSPNVEDCCLVSSTSVNASIIIISPTSSPTLEGNKSATLSRKPSKYRLSPELSLVKPPSPEVTSPTIHDSLDDTIILTPPRFDLLPIFKTSVVEGSSNKTPHDCLSPDLVESDDDRQLNNSLNEIVAVQTGGEEIECFDLTQSDDEDKSVHYEDSVNQKSDLNITDYVKDLLRTNSQEENTAPSHRLSGKLEKISTSDDSQLSQQSQGISDEELNYSSVFSSPPKQKYDFDDDEYYVEAPLEQRIKSRFSKSPHNPDNKNSQQVNNPPVLEDSLNGVLDEIQTPSKPDNSNFIVKTTNITPMANYDEMDTPKIIKELDKFGLKPLKRQKGATLLKYIYNSTHPVVQDENGKVLKKRRTQLRYPQPGGEITLADLGEEEDLIFERTQSKRISSCRIPLHIVWHNFVTSNPKIREGILLYEPLQLEVLHSMIKEQGFKFNIQDLLSFLDSKCVTIRTAQGDRRKCK